MKISKIVLAFIFSYCLSVQDILERYTEIRNIILYHSRSFNNKDSKDDYENLPENKNRFKIYTTKSVKRKSIRSVYIDSVMNQKTKKEKMESFSSIDDKNIEDSLISAEELLDLVVVKEEKRDSLDSEQMSHSLFKEVEVDLGESDDFLDLSNRADPFLKDPIVIPESFGDENDENLKEEVKTLSSDTETPLYVDENTAAQFIMKILQYIKIQPESDQDKSKSSYEIHTEAINKEEDEDDKKDENRMKKEIVPENKNIEHSLSTSSSWISKIKKGQDIIQMVPTIQIGANYLLNGLNNIKNLSPNFIGKPGENAFIESKHEASVGSYPRQFQLLWDDSFLRETVKLYKMDHLLDFLLNLLTKTNAFIKSFIKFTGNSEIIRIDKGFNQCSDGLETFGYALTGDKFTQKVEINADHVIFVYGVDKNVNILASAKPCGAKGSIGMLRINFFKLAQLDKFSAMRHEKKWLRTIIHEVLHIFAFHKIILSDFKMKVTEKLPYLFKLAKAEGDVLVDKEAHWNPQYISNDLMIPVDRPDSIISIFSLEYLSLANSKFSTRMENLPMNPLIDSISDWSSYLKYQCSDNLPSEYPHMCSNIERLTNEGYGCSQNYEYRTLCGKNQFKNRCFERVAVASGMCMEERTQNSFEFEYFGQDSRCLVANDIGGICVKTSLQAGNFFMIVGSREVKCTHKGEKHQFVVKEQESEIGISISCPDPSDFIKRYSQASCPDDCNNNGICNQGKCYCFEGYLESDHCRSYDSSSTSSPINIGAIFSF